MTAKAAITGDHNEADGLHVAGLQERDVQLLGLHLRQKPLSKFSLQAAPECVRKT